MNDPTAPVELTHYGTVRKKAWGTRARTGCYTCRIRRIKCDEARPVCQRCIKSNRECRGYLVPLPTHETAVQVWQHQASRGERICPEAEPPDWDYTQAVYYYFAVVKADCTDLVDPWFNTKNLVKCRFICQMLADQLTLACKARNRFLIPGEDPAFAGIWTKLYRYIGESIDIVNQCIRDEGPYGGKSGVLLGIFYLFFLDIATRPSAWQAHMNGYLAFLEHLGGITTVLEQPNPPLSSLHLVVMIGTPLNTTTPASRQIEGFDTFSDDALKVCFDVLFEVDMPCPVDFLVTIVHITRVRGTVARARKRNSVRQKELAVMEETSQKILKRFDTMPQFDAETWANEQLSRSETVRPVLAHIFGVAIRLYGILTLPKQIIIPWASSVTDQYPTRPGLSIYHSVRMQHREELLTLLRETWDTTPNLGGLSWPLVVAGVAASDGGDENQRFIDKCLLTIWKNPHVAPTFMMAIEKLRSFWKSGETGWEQCFDEPTMCYP